MRFAFSEWPQLVVFAALVLTVTLYALAISVHFPAEHRRASLRDASGTAVLWGTSAVAILAAIIAVVTGWAVLPGAVAVLVGGTAVLIAPMALKVFPDSLIDDRGGLVMFAALSGGLALVLLRYL